MMRMISRLRVDQNRIGVRGQIRIGGYKIIRLRGNHVRLRKLTVAGDHNITVPLHDELAKGTFKDILSQISIWNGISEDALIEMIKQS